MRTVVFDLDGTLVDTSADLVAAANACFRARGLGDVLDPEADAAVAFRGGRAMLTEGFSRCGAGGNAEIEADYPKLLEAYGAAIAVHSRPYDGAWGAVETLKNRGFAVAICTNKPERFAIRLMEEMGTFHVLPTIVGADTLPVRKPDPETYLEAVRRAGGDPARSIFVGDTETDVNTARAAGVPIVLVGFGPEGQGVSRLGPDAMLDHFADLPDLADSLLPAG
ncbi:phosphoglycolate phosphatase [Palleronia marisminoris]|uniref:phosphoglycolate phosphatase n=1 Tax=Palleronia marisminoris TaxID=315423 RepID=A0A1Y5RFQ4_9RHOB|nr:HAD-IA family hydrolase [Palleronia marisminoris]SFG16755.1 phosphoglycolate phosphatase [Palleronia marisminoris]SLN16432.1 Phosphoglycolate phosphatase [Palleronia marisminoris]